MRAFGHYFFSIAILSIYGGEVCPFIASLDIVTWLILLIIVCGTGFFLRPRLITMYVSRLPFEVQVKNQFILEMTFFVTMALFISIFNMIIYDFPIESGLKVLLGFLTLGFFASADLALEREREISKEISSSGHNFSIEQKIFPLTKKFTLVASFSLIFLTAIVFTVISRDLIWLGEIDQSNLFAPRAAILIELLFIGIVTLLEIINLIISYSNNLKLFFSSENNALTDVAEGNLNSRVPVSTNDEFGVMAKYTNLMINNLNERTRELQLTQDVTILSLASLAETRDPETGAHILRTQRYVKILAEHLKDHSRFSKLLKPEIIELLFKSAPLHDIGKVGVKDAILLKPGKLTDEEFEEMKKHAGYGQDSLLKAEKILGSSSFLRLAREIAYTHHEKWDGTGYPRGLKEDDIPISGRLMALADVYDALISKRVYKKTFSHEKTREIIVEGKAKHFDPDIVDAFLKIENDFIKIAREFVDSKDKELAA
tara:strand:+ start:1759 stop:3216 length:1458 start_codon:yes stop_codon:yes gene_type:complete